MEKVIARAGQRGGAQAARAQRENQEAEHAPHTSLFWPWSEGGKRLGDAEALATGRPNPNCTQTLEKHHDTGPCPQRYWPVAAWASSRLSAHSGLNFDGNSAGGGGWQ